MHKRIGVILVVAGILVVPAVWPALAVLVIDLQVPNAVDIVLFGQETEDFFGTDLATGDINGDGIDDLVVGAYLADGPGDARSGAGEVYVYYGRPAASWPARGRQPDVTVYGAAVGDALGGDDWKEPGHIVVGDLDNDGTGDLILSAPAYGSTYGRVWIIWGRQDLPHAIDLARIPSVLEVTTISATAREALGSAMAAGDFDGDGIDDLAMSAPLAAGGKPPRFHSGMVYGIFGQPDLRGRQIQLGAVPTDISMFTVIGPSREAKLGSYLAFGKLSADSVDDLVMGAEKAAGEMGAVHVLFGGDTVRGFSWDLLETPSDWSVIGEEPFDQMGHSLAVGDVNGDEQSDLVMGAPSADGPAGPGTGQVVVIYGPLPQGIERDLSVSPGDLTIYGPQGGVEDQAWLGEVGVGDFNHDNVEDILAGARQANGFDSRGESGIVYVIYGRASLSGAIDLSVTVTDITLVGAEARDFTGYVVVGDVNGDGIDDIVTSATDRRGEDGGLMTGAAYVLFGARALITPSPIHSPTVTPSGTLTVTPTSPTVTRTPTPTGTPTTKPTHVIYMPLSMRDYVVSW